MEKKVGERNVPQRPGIGACRFWLLHSFIVSADQGLQRAEFFAQSENTIRIISHRK